MRRGWKRNIAKLLAVSMIFVNIPVYGAVPARVAGGLCEHHRSHTEDCGYKPGTPGTPCSHEHTEDCYVLVENCVHEHTADCYPEESGSEDTATPSEADKAEPTECNHVCSEESGCITEELDCQHEHDEDCGYSPAEPGTPCTYVCEICYPQGGDRPESTKPEVEKVSTPSDALEMTPEQMKAMLAVENPVASVTIDGVKTEYASLGEAINAADGKTATITLLQSTSENLTGKSIMSGNIILQLNEQSMNNSGGFYVYGGSVAITGSGTIDEVSVHGGIVFIEESATISFLAIVSEGKVVVKGGSIENVNGTIDKYEPQSIGLNQDALSLDIDGTSTLTATITPNISAPNFPTWTSSDPSVATVAGNGPNAKVTAKKAGTATITVTAGVKTATCTVEVKEPQSSTVNVSITGIGVTENNGTYSAAYGSSVTVTADIAAASTNAKTRAAAKNTVDFYLGSIADENKLNVQPITVTDNKAALALTLTGEKWNAGTTPYTILADFDGSDALKENNGTAQLTITPASINGNLSITGDAVPGGTLTANYTPTSGEAVSYQWKRDSGNIPGATGETYVVADGDVGKKITVTVTASDTNHEGSLTSDPVTVNKAEQGKPASGEGYTINFSEETITAKDGYELAESQEAATGQETLSVTPGTDVYVRKAGTASYNPSDWTSVDVPARPAAPAGITAEKEAFQGEKGKLTGVTTAMQYQLEGATTWTDCTNVQNGVISLDPGTYKVRLKATVSEFASAETSPLEIKAGDARTYTLELTAPVFDSVKVGYAQPAAKNLVIKSTGNSDTTVTGMTLGGDNADAFVLNKTDGTKLTAGSTDSATYTIQPASGLSAGTYTAVVTAAYDNGGKAATVTAEITFTVQAAQLAAPQNVALESTKPGSVTVRWSAVTNARSYSVQLYKDGKAQGDAVPVSSDKTAQEFDISAAGSYKVKVKAVGDRTDYTDSEETESTALAFYTVAFDPNGGNAVGSQIVAEGGKAEKPADPARTGYAFAGWYKESNFLNGWDFDTDEVSGATMLYAKWTAISYTVTVTAEGGTGNTASAFPASASLGTPVTLTYRATESCHFVKWEVISGGITISGNRFAMPANNVTIKAVFEKKSSGGNTGGDGNMSGGSTGGGGGTITGTPPDYAVRGKWIQNADGTWSFTDTAGSFYQNRWAYVENSYANTAAGQQLYDWFRFDENGTMATGWYYDASDGCWYYLNPVSDNTLGRMMTGWQRIGEYDYYFNPVSDGHRGRMYANEMTPDRHYVNENGIRVR